MGARLPEQRLSLRDLRKLSGWTAPHPNAQAGTYLNPVAPRDPSYVGRHTAQVVLAGSQEVRGSNPLGSTV